MPRNRKPRNSRTAFGGPRSGRPAARVSFGSARSKRPSSSSATAVSRSNPGVKIMVPSRTPSGVASNRTPSGATPSVTSKPGASKPEAEFRMKRHKQLKERLSALRGGDTGKKQAKRGKSVARKLNLDTRINELRSIEDRSEEQESKLDTLKEKYTKEQAKFAAKADFGDAKPVKDKPAAETSDRAAFLARLRENRYQRVGKGRRRAVRRSPRNRARFTSAVR